MDDENSGGTTRRYMVIRDVLPLRAYGLRSSISIHCHAHDKSIASQRSSEERGFTKYLTGDRCTRMRCVVDRYQRIRVGVQGNALPAGMAIHVAQAMSIAYLLKRSKEARQFAFKCWRGGTVSRRRQMSLKYRRQISPRAESQFHG